MDRSRRHQTILLALLVFGVVLRVRQYAACPSYWYDEAYLLLNVFHKSFLDLLGPLREDQAAPPLFLWALRGLYQIAGGSEWCMRLPALAASVAGLLIMVPLARRVAGRRGGLWAVAFCAFGHHAAAHGGEVKPYTVDFLMTELILLAALRCQAVVSSWRPRIALCLLAAIAPWVSYPSVFVLGGAALSFLRQPAAPARDTKTLAGAAGWRAAFVVLFALSTFILWQTVARHQATSALGEFWASSFLDLSSPGAAAAWMGRCLIEIGNYGTREMGLPLLVLALVGAASLWRRWPSRVVLLAGPLPLALIACALHRYPLGGRLLFFLVPCVWLLAARGVGALLQRLPSRLAQWGWVLPAVLLVPAALWSGRLLLVVTPRCQFREAFAYVESHREPDDVLWVSHPQVYEVYYGRAPDLDAYSPPETVEQAACTGRLWMVCAVAGSRERFTAGATVDRVRAAPCMAADRRRFKGLEVILYAPRIEPRPLLPSDSESEK
ncbi:MAG TPA: glycosyltransferase family 39 protein [Gemmataceae bacterium]|jgi:hypothetical protein